MEKILTIIPSFYCPYKCNFCISGLRASETTLLDINILNDILKNYKFNKIVISGGEPSLLDNNYLNNLIKSCKERTKEVILESYPVSKININDDIIYNFSYDFLAKPRAYETWNNLMEFDKPFNITLTLSPILYKYHPISILKKLSLLPNLIEIHFKPYLKNKMVGWNNNTLVELKYLETLLSNNISTKFNIKNRDEIINILKNKDTSYKNTYLLPNGKFHIITDENKIFDYKEIENIEDTPISNLNYSSELLNWAKTNVKY